MKFETYASLRIRGAILDQIRKMDWIPRTVRQKQKKIDEAIRMIEITNENGEKDKLMTPRQLAQYLESSISALSQYRALGTGPEYFKIGKMVRYRKSDVNQWLEQQRIGKK